MASNIVFDGTKGISLPSFTTTEKNAIVSPATGAQIYDTTLKSICTYNGSAWITTTDNSSIQTLTNKTINGGALQSGTAKAYNWNGSTTNTFIDFDTIPSWVKRITVMFNGVSTSGTSVRLIRLSTGGVFATSGYTGACDVMASGVAPNNFSVGFNWSDNPGVAADTVIGTYVFTLVGSNTWIGTLTGGFSNTTSIISGGGAVTLGGTLDGIRITTVNGTDTFDAGSINILYE